MENKTGSDQTAPNQQPETMPTILLADDDPSIIKLLSIITGSMGYRYLIAEDGARALELLNDHQVSLLISDIEMPRLNGLALLKEVRRHFPGTNVLIMTGYTDDYTFSDLIAAGAVDFMTKPFTIEEAKAKLERIFKEQRLITALQNEIAARKEKEIEIEQYSKRIKTLVNFISHDIKNPVIALQGLTRRMKKLYGEAINHKGRGMCELIIKSADEISNFVQIINDYIASKDMPLATEQVMLHEILQTLKAENEPYLLSRGITWIEPEYIPPIRANKVELGRVFRNLLDNALKHGGENLSKIQIDYKETKKFHIISVSNDGTTVNMERQQAIFQPFVRNSHSPAAKGCGLGLAIVQEIAEKHGGAAWGEANSPSGMSFSISINKFLNNSSDKR